MSLLGGWDQELPGSVPEPFRDFEEPSKQPRKPATTLPSLARVSCPAVLVHSHSKKEGGGEHVLVSKSSPRSTTHTHISIGRQRSSLERTSVPSVGSPRSPRSPESTGHHHHHPGGLFDKLLHEECEEDKSGVCDLKWCERVDSGCLNVRPDDPKDLEAWRTGSFTPDDPVHCLHFSMREHRDGENDEQTGKKDE